MKKALFSAFLLSAVAVNAQIGKVGINTNNPKATLDIQPSPANALSTATTNEGVLIPKLSKTRVANIATPEDATMIYVSDVTYTGTNPAVADITSKGFYYYDEDPVMPANSKWKKLNVNAGGTNLYNTDGTLADNRTVNMNGKNLSFTGTGNVGIGTNNPSVKLDVIGKGKMDYLQIRPQDNAYEGGELELLGSPGKNNVVLDNFDGIFRIHGGPIGAVFHARTDNGNIGIGTGNPGLKLHVESSNDHKIRLQHQGSGDHTDFIKRPNGTFAIYNGTNSTAWKGPLSINNSGFVGIGTESPDRHLQVLGGIRSVNLYLDQHIDANHLHSRNGLYTVGSIDTNHLHSRNGIYAVGHADVNTLNVRSGFSANSLTANTIKANQYLKLPRNWEGGGDVCNADNVGAIRVKWMASNINGILVDNYVQICLKKNNRNEYDWYKLLIGW